ncbi:MAG: hypothetical protein HY821_19545 [Acidobacteria bacterium]|nr:hypothetical protein [Acidobacteriota bacterium]
MDLEPANQAEGGLSERACRFVAGLDVGLAGALSAICWLVFHSFLRREFWWAKLNVAGGFFYGPGVYTMGVGRATLAGFSLLLVTYAALGSAFGLAARPRRTGRNFLLVTVWGLGWHLFAQSFYWPSMDVFAPAYFPKMATVPADLLFALSLSRFSSRFHSLACSLGDPSWALAIQEPEDSAPEAAASQVDDGLEAGKSAAAEVRAEADSEAPAALPSAPVDEPEAPAVAALDDIQGAPGQAPAVASTDPASNLGPSPGQGS